MGKWKDKDKLNAWTRKYNKTPKRRKYHNDYMKRWRKEHIDWWLWSTAKRRAKKYGLEFNIEVSDVVIPSTCPVLGIRIRVEEGHCRDGSPTLDRRDNDKGYVKGNVFVISWRANTIKSSASAFELRQVADYCGSI